MNIKINAVKVNPNEQLENYINEKVKKLQQVNDRITNVEVILKTENIQNGENKITEIKVELPGGEFFARKQSDTFKDSVDQAIEAVRKQIQKHKEKLRGL